MNQLVTAFQASGEQFISNFKSNSLDRTNPVSIYPNLDGKQSFPIAQQQPTPYQSSIVPQTYTPFAFKVNMDIEDQLTDVSIPQFIEKMKLDMIIETFGDNEIDIHITDILYVESLQQLVVSNKSGLIQFFDNKFAPLKKIQQQGTCLCLGFLAHSQLLISHQGEFNANKLNFWNFANGELVRTLQASSEPIWKIKALDSDQFVTCCGDGSISIWSATEKVRGASIHTACVQDALLFNKSLLITASQDESIVFFSLTQNKVVGTIKDDDSVYCLEKVSDNVICTGNGQGMIKCYQVSNYELLVQYKIHESYISGLFIIGEFYVATSSNDRTVKLTRLQDGKLLNQFEKDLEYTNDSEPLLFVPQFKRLVYGDWNKLVVQE